MESNRMSLEIERPETTLREFEEMSPAKQASWIEFQYQKCLIKKQREFFEETEQIYFQTTGQGGRDIHLIPKEEVT